MQGGRGNGQHKPGEAGPPSGRGPKIGDLIAGITVACIVIPQALAYAELVGAPPQRGLYVAMIGTLVAAPFGSSPYLQAGPVAVHALLALGAVSLLEPFGSPEYVATLTLLALVVGAVRLTIGLLRLGGIAFLMSQPVIIGFTAGAATVIVLQQLPAALGAGGANDDILDDAFTAVIHPDRWARSSVLLSLATVAIVFAGRRVSPLFPGVLLAVAAGIAVSAATGYDGPVVGSIPSGLPQLDFDLPWGNLPTLVLPGIVIAVIGFAETTAIARTYAAMDRTEWDPSQEMVSQGLANLGAGLVGGFPAGSSFTRSSINRLAGARTRWSGAVTGLAVLAFLPFTGALSDLPKAVLAGVVISAVCTHVNPKPFLELRRYAKVQLKIALATFALTLALAPQVQNAVLVGIGLAVAIHLRREILISVPTWTEGDVLHLKPKGVLYFGSAPGLERTFLALLHEHPDARSMVVHLDGLGRVDVTGALALRALLNDAVTAGLRAEVADVPPQAEKIITRVLSSPPGAPPRIRRGRGRGPAAPPGSR